MAPGSCLCCVIFDANWRVNFNRFSAAFHPIFGMPSAPDSLDSVDTVAAADHGTCRREGRPVLVVAIAPSAAPGGAIRSWTSPAAVEGSRRSVLACRTRSTDSGTSSSSKVFVLQ
jgi:hypothetical protein